MASRILASLLGSAVILTTALAAAHPVTADGNPSEWLTRVPNAANLGLIARNAMGQGEYIWRDATADTRTDVATPEVVADIAAFQVTGDATGIGFLLRRQPGVMLAGAPIQVQIAIDTDRVAGSGQTFFAGFADTKVAEGARWERLVQTLFGSGGQAQVIDTNFNKVADATAAVGTGGDVEIFVPWSALGLNGPPATPLRFTVATFRAQNNDLTVDIGGANISNALDSVGDFGDPTAANYPNTWKDVMDQVVDYSFDLHFDTSGEVYAPLVIQRFLSNASGGGADEWYAVRNVSPGPLPLAGFKLGDEETPDGNEGMFSFPAGATLAAGATYVVARSGSAYQAFFGQAPDAELPPGASAVVPDMAAFAAWTSAANPDLQLGNAGDELLVLDPSNTILDIAVFGNGAYAGVNAVAAPGTDEVATRAATSADTDDCAVDFGNAGKACTTDAQCGGICRQCAGNVCGNKPQGAACPNANPCDGDEICDGNGACVTSPAPPCDDQNPCTADACTPSMGCTHTPVAAGTSCSDGDVCNGVEVCDANAVCVAGTPLVCADTDPCTVDTCDKVMGCQHAQAADGTSCADGDACNGAEVCMGGTCMAGTAPDCDDQNPCTTDVCDMAAGCTHTNVSDGTSCADADVCNGAEVCVGGACTAESPLDCDDGNDCTVDSCDMTGGCQHAQAADGTTCGDANCAGMCASGSCQCGMGGSGGGSASSSSGAMSSSSSSSGSATSSSGGGGEGGGTGGTGGSGIMDSACGCRTVGGDDASPATWLLGLAALGAFSRRRRSR
ncbi:MAG: lamin tail domain-containing protein [Minicystis sp.]